MELKRRDRAQVLTEIVEFIALPFPFPSKLKISRLSYAGTAKTCTEKRVASAELLFCSLNLLVIDDPVAVALVHVKSLGFDSCRGETFFFFRSRFVLFLKKKKKKHARSVWQHQFIRK